MKIGMRKPSIKRSISARTTGKLKRTVNKAVNPLYGQKGMGYINNPKKTVYNMVYNKTTIGVNDVINSTSHKTSSNNSTVNYQVHQQPAQQNSTVIDISKYRSSASTYKGTGTFLIIVAWIMCIAGVFTLPIGLIFIGLAILFGSVGKTYKKVAKIKSGVTTTDFAETPSKQETAQTEQNSFTPTEHPQKVRNSNFPPVPFDTMLVYNGTPKMQFEIKQCSIGDTLTFDQDENDSYLVSTQNAYDIGYLHKRIAEKIDSLANEGYEITGGHIAEIIQADEKWNVKVHIVLEYQDE